jgi:hypothetical protein
VALWQFMTFTVLIGALLIYASIITRRLGCADARLNRIEEALRANRRSIDSAETRAAGAKPEVSSGQAGRRGYLTVRDLRQLSGCATRASSRESAAVSAWRDTLKATRGPVRPPGATPECRGSVARGLESRDAPATSSERPKLLSEDAVGGDSVATTLQAHEAAATECGLKSPPGYRPPSDDSVARKNRDLAIFLSNQRRRRRARLGY